MNTITNPLSPSAPTITVLVNEEYGYRLWLWATGMTEAELTAYWAGLTDLPQTPQGLRGTATEVAEDDGDLFSVNENTGEMSDEPVAHIPRKVAPWTAHYDLSDSYLVRPNGEKVLHAGYYDPYSDDADNAQDAEQTEEEA